MAERIPGEQPTPARPPRLPDGGTLRLPEHLVLARARAEDLIATAEQQARALTEQAAAERDHAHAEGLQAGHQQARAEAAELLARARVEAARRAADAEPELVRLAVHIAGRLIQHELTQSPQAIAELAAGVLGEVREQQPLELVLHPDDAQALEQARPRLFSLIGELPELQIHGEPSMARGDCLVRGPDLAVDGRLKTRLDNLERALLDAPEER